MPGRAPAKAGSLEPWGPTRQDVAMEVGCFDHPRQGQPLARLWRFVWIPGIAVFPAVVMGLRRHP